MSPLMLIVFLPVVVGAIAFFALLCGAAATGSWEAFEERRHERSLAIPEEPARVAAPGPESAHARVA